MATKKPKETKGGHKTTPDPVPANYGVPGVGYDPRYHEEAYTGPGTAAAGGYTPDPFGFRSAEEGQPKAGPKYIGVPSPTWEQDAEGNWVLQPGYSRTVSQGAAGVGIPDWAAGQTMLTPLYYENDEYALISGLGLSEEAVAAIQARMAAAHLMPKEYHVGKWMGDSAAAFKEVLAYANQTTQSWQSALEDLVSGAAGFAPEKGPKGPVFTAHLSNPDDIKKAYKDVRYALLGGQFTDETQGDAFVTAFQTQELNAQRASFNAQVGGGGEVVEAPNVATAAETQLEETDTAGLQAKRYLDYSNVLGSILGQRSPSTDAA